MSGTTTLVKYIEVVTRNLVHLFEAFGIEKYKEKWIEHDFSHKEYKILLAVIS